MAEIPAPTYDYEVAILRGYYEKAISEIERELNSLALTTFEMAQTKATLASIREILAELDGKSGEWATVNMEKAVSDGVARSLIGLGLASSLTEAQGIVKFNRLNANLIKTAVADTQDDLLQVTQNIDRKVRTAIRQATAETMRANLTRGINGTASLRRDLVSLLDEATKTGIIDAIGRRWKPEVYAEMVVRTKMLASHKEATINEAVKRGAYYGVISKHGATDACRNWEGKIVKLTREADGDYPYIGDIPRRELFHPNCKHVVSPVRRPDRYE